MLRMSSLVLALGFVVCAPKDDPPASVAAALTSNKVTLAVEQVAGPERKGAPAVLPVSTQLPVPAASVIVQLPPAPLTATVPVGVPLPPLTVAVIVEVPPIVITNANPTSTTMSA